MDIVQRQLPDALGNGTSPKSARGRIPNRGLYAGFPLLWRAQALSCPIDCERLTWLTPSGPWPMSPLQLRFRDRSKTFRTLPSLRIATAPPRPAAQGEYEERVGEEREGLG